MKPHLKLRTTSGLKSPIIAAENRGMYCYGKGRVTVQDMINHSTPVTSNNSATTSQSPKNSDPRQQNPRKAGHKSHLNSPMLRGTESNKAAIMRPSSAYRHTALKNKFIRQDTEANSPSLSRVWGWGILYIDWSERNIPWGNYAKLCSPK